MDNRTLPPLNRFTDHLEPSGVMQRMDETLANNDFILAELARAKARAKHWKILWTREVMKHVDQTVVSYGRFELDHAEAEAMFWHDTIDGRGVLVERQS
jgi:hypothetical protein